MIRKIIVWNLAGYFLFAFGGVSLADSADTQDSHLQVINQELDQIESYLNNQIISTSSTSTQTASVSTASAPTASPTRGPMVVSLSPITVNMPAPKAVAKEEAPLLTNSIPVPRENEFEIGPEFYWAQFREPTSFSEKGFMSGFDAKYTHHFTNNTKIPINMVGLQGQWAWGKFKEPPTEGPSGIKDNTYDLRAVVGKDFHPMTHLRTTAYTGFGYRYLNDNSAGLQSVINGVSILGYDRISNYAYLPLGMDFVYQTDPRYSWQSNLEYDVLLHGWQIDKLGVVPGYNTLNVGQKDGFGLRASIRFNWNFKYYTLFSEWFYRYWNVSQSQSKPDPTDPSLPPLYEAKNSTSEFGLRLGLDI